MLNGEIGVTRGLKFKIEIEICEENNEGLIEQKSHHYYFINGAVWIQGIGWK